MSAEQPPLTRVALARDAMATRFELLLEGNDPVSLRAAGEQALDEIERLEAQLSLYRPTSEISRLNARAALEPVKVSPLVFDLLQRCAELAALTDGAFDITVAPLIRVWGFMHGTGELPEPEALAAARDRVGMRHVAFDPETRTIRFRRPGMMLDLGAVGKGYAIDAAVEVLREAGITRGFIHGGTSTSYGLGVPGAGRPWKAGVIETEAEPAAAHFDHAGETEKAADRWLATVTLENRSLSVSGVKGKAFRAAGRTYGHVLDPRWGRPVQGARVAAVASASATETDALSTALLVLGADGFARLRRLRPEMDLLAVLEEAAGGRKELRHGFGDGSQVG